MNANRAIQAIPKDNNVDQLTRSILGGTAIAASTTSLTVILIYQYLLLQYTYNYNR